MDDDQTLDDLKGKTLAVYFFLLRQTKPISARQIQRRMGISSPSLVLYHLKKLEDLELVEMDQIDGFRVTKYIRVGILRFFVGLDGFFLPRYVFYSLFAISYLIGALWLFGWYLTPHFILLVVFSSFSIIVFLYEAVSMWRSRPTI
ncbi:MAG: ArsR family transcriptional regulator [Candidatus Thorarchaeota archaeon]|nr:MAG: ArsR family transcriptional regulator [Candidatus Thorarchaeota archaeon]